MTMIAATYDEATDWLAEYVPYKDVVIGLDCETTGLDTYDPEWRLRLIQLSYEGNVLLIDPHHDPFNWGKLFKHPRLTFVSHTDIDIEFIEAGLGIRVRSWHDTHLMSRVYNETDENGLKFLSQEFLGRQDLVAAEEALNARFKELAPKGVRGANKIKTWGFANIPLDDPVYLEYAGLDAVVVEQLFHYLHSRINRQLWEREEWLAREMYLARRHGIRLDVPKAQTYYAQFDSEYTKTAEDIEALTGLPADSLYLVEWLDEQGVSFNAKYTTKTGRPSLSRDQLEWLQVHTEGKAEELVNLKLHRSDVKNLRTVVNGFLTHQHQGWLHPKVKTMEARTGRMSVTNPPLQTLKKEDQRLRGLLMADMGTVLVASDFSQVEIRVAAALSQDPTLVKIIQEGMDMHSETARSIWGDDFTKHQRQLAKILNFGAIYGGGPRALSQQAGISMAEARKIHKSWKDTYPGLVAYGEQLGRKREVLNPFGRRLRIDQDRPYSALNYMIQSTARDILVERMHSMSDLMHMFWMVVHDELIFKVPSLQSEELCVTIQERMATELNGIPIPAEAEILGDRWGNER